MRDDFYPSDPSESGNVEIPCFARLTRKTAGKPDAERFIRERIVTNILECLLEARIAFLSLPGPALKQDQQTVTPPF